MRVSQLHSFNGGSHKLTPRVSEQVQKNCSGFEFQFWYFCNAHERLSKPSSRESLILFSFSKDKTQKTQKIFLDEQVNFNTTLSGNQYYVEK